MTEDTIRETWSALHKEWGEVEVLRRRALQVREQRVKRLEEVTAQVDLNDKAKVVLQVIERTQHEELRKKLEGLITCALQAVFHRPLLFRVEFDTHGTQTTASFLVQDEFGHVVPFKDAHGGGLLVVASFLLRIIILKSTQPAIRTIICHDEPFNHVSGDYREKLTEFLQSLAKSSDLQLLFVTHLTELAEIGSRQYRFRLLGGKTQAKEL